MLPTHSFLQLTEAPTEECGLICRKSKQECQVFWMLYLFSTMNCIAKAKDRSKYLMNATRGHGMDLFGLWKAKPVSALVLLNIPFLESSWRLIWPQPRPCHTRRWDVSSYERHQTRPRLIGWFQWNNRSAQTSTLPWQDFPTQTRIKYVLLEYEAAFPCFSCVSWPPTVRTNSRSSNRVLGF